MKFHGNNINPIGTINKSIRIPEFSLFNFRLSWSFNGSSQGCIVLVNALLTVKISRDRRMEWPENVITPRPWGAKKFSRRKFFRRPSTFDLRSIVRVSEGNEADVMVRIHNETVYGVKEVTRRNRIVIFDQFVV